MANKRISELTSITGANLADADLLVVVDVSDTTMAASGTNKKVTLNEFAQDSTFSSRYAPLGTVFVEAERFSIGSGASKGTLGSPDANDIGAVFFDGSAYEFITSTWFAPTNWATYDAYIWWTNAGVGAGDVVWDGSVHNLSVGGSSNSATGLPLTTVTAPAQYVVARTKLTATPASCTAGQLQKFLLFRDPTDPGDTLTNDAAFFGVELVRAS